MASNERKRSDTITAAYIAGAFLLVGIVLTAFVTPVVPKFLDWLLGRSAVKPDSHPPIPVAQVLTDEQLRAEGCHNPAVGKCLACEKPITFNNYKAGIIIDRLECAHMPEDHDVRAAFDGYVVTKHPQLPDNCFNTDVDLELRLTGSPRVPQENIGLTGECPPFKLESRKRAPQAESLAVELVLVTCQSGSTPDTCWTYLHPATLRIEAVPGAAPP
jgi:hypothetical protein